METFLNLVWVSLAVGAVCLWKRHENRSGLECCLPIVALAMLLIILFPVISVSDDLWALQNPAEADTCVRRDQIAPCPYSILPALAELPTLAYGSIHIEVRHFSDPAWTERRSYLVPVLDSIENRPPPTA